MPRDIAPLTRALDSATPGTQNDIYTLLATWNTAIETALDRGGGSRFREIMTQYLAEVIELVDTAATADGIDWAFLQECVDAYPPGVGDHHCSGVLANVVARCVIRTRIRDGVDAIPAWALEYLDAITMDADGDWAWESAVAVGWGVGHSQVDVLDRTLARAEAGDESWAIGVLKHVTFADPDAGVDLLERLLRSPDTVGWCWLFDSLDGTGTGVSTRSHVHGGIDSEQQYRDGVYILESGISLQKALTGPRHHTDVWTDAGDLRWGGCWYWCCSQVAGRRDHSKWSGRQPTRSLPTW